MDCSPPGSSVYGIFQARVLEWGAIAFSERFPHAMQQLSPWLQLLSPSPITKTRHNQVNKYFLKLNYIWEHTTSRLTWEAHISYFCHDTLFYLSFQNECSALCEMGIPVSEGLRILFLFPHTITLWTLSCNVCSISLSILLWAMASFPPRNERATYCCYPGSSGNF